MKKDDQAIWVGSDNFNKKEELLEQSNNEFFEVPVMNEVASSDSDNHRASSSNTNRRDFLKYLGFGLGAAVVAASCETPVRRAIPYLQTPDQIVPGVATYYASAYSKAGDFCPIIVKTREGRPIKIEGNRMSPMTKGGTSARAQAYVLELYDRSRLKAPGKRNEDGGFDKMSWEDIDKAIETGLSSSSNIKVVSHTNLSPTHKKVLDSFLAKYPNASVVTYDAISYAAMLDAQEQSTGMRVLPDYHFDKADVIANFGADFLGTWISPVEYARDYAKRRSIKDTDNPDQLRMIAFETGMSLTGSNADNRVLIKPSEKGLAIAKLHDAVASKTGGARVGASGTFANKKADKAIEHTADDLVNARGASLVISNSNNVAEQLLVNHMNEMLGNIGKTITYTHHSLQRQGSDKDINDLIKEMRAGMVDALIVLNEANPVYDLPEGEEFGEMMKNVKLSISTNNLPNETMARCMYSVPSHHGLESWGDSEPKKGHVYISQPTISPLFDTREEDLSLLKWAGVVDKTEQNETYYQYLRENWRDSIFSAQNEFMSFDSFWNYSLNNGFAKTNSSASGVTTQTDISGLASKINKPFSSGTELEFYETVNIGSGNHANNPWLQEMPDPIMRTVWDNFARVPVAWDGERYFEGYKNLEDGDKVTVKSGDVSHDMTVVQGFGQMNDTASIALGYGRKVSGAAGKDVGTDVYPLMSRNSDGYVQFYNTSATISEKIGEDDTFASVQYHHTMGLTGKEESTGKLINVDEKAVMTLAPGFQGGLTDRTIIRQTDLDDFSEKVEDLHHEIEHADYLNSKTLYPGFAERYAEGHKWGMNIDLSSCIGCGACQVACIAENNVPIVGKNEVRRHHEMTWLRIDRYYYGDSESPNVVYQPMICQHCDNAPCENVCPVNATNHSFEGVNQMIYNRCIGTRYCANNCPYKVRRFNWLDYTTADLFGMNENHPVDDSAEVPFYADNLTRMVLNPDVTVRSRGVMEKCSFCIQRIQEGKLTAKKEMRPLHDGDVVTACASACPTGAIVFGDVNDKKSEISEEMENPLSYKVLMEINTRPAVTYKMKVVNRNENITDPNKLG